jgi:vancomycin aglycone glucosyltransferase
VQNRCSRVDSAARRTGDDVRVLLSTIGSRGEVQPVVALALQLAGLGHEAVVCAPPDFEGWARSLGVEYAPVGPWLHGTATARPRGMPTVEERQAMIAGTVAEQFRVVASVGRGCDAVVGGGALAIAAHSVAEREDVPYVYAAFAPITLPSPHHAPPTFGMLGGSMANGPEDFPRLWADDHERWNAQWRGPLNARRANLGLPPVDDVRSHLFTATPWLAADPVLAPWPGAPGLDVLQTGAWLLADRRPLDPALDAFLDSGAPPVYLGFGSVRAPQGVAATTIAVARSLGRRVVLSRGWADLDAEAQADCFVVDEVNQQALFPRVAAVIHHGGAGTTTAAALAGTPQVVVPQMFDQHYHGGRVAALGIGSTLVGTVTEDALRDALASALTAATTQRAESVAATVEREGAAHAARRLLQLR